MFSKLFYFKLGFAFNFKGLSSVKFSLESRNLVLLISDEFSVFLSNSNVAV